MGPQADLSDAEEACAGADAGAEEACVRGELSLARRDFDAAERDFRAVLVLAGESDGSGGPREGCDGASDVSDPTALRGRARIGLGRVRLAAGDAEEGAAEFRRAHESAPDASGPLHWLGCAAAHQGAYESADEYFTSALACTSPQPRSRVQRAYVRVRLRRYEDALSDLRAADEESGLDADARCVTAALSGEGGAGGTGRLALVLRKAALGELAEAGEVEGEVSGGQGGSAYGAGRAGPTLARGARLLDASLTLSGTVEREFVPLYAVALILGGRREAAVALLEGATRSHPADHRITHTLALALLNSPVRQPGRTHENADAGRRWERCVAAWGALLHDDAFWEHRRTSAGGRFRVPVDAATCLDLRGDLRELLERRVPEDDAGSRVPPGALLQREADAARTLAGVGGLSAEGGGSPLVGGPLRIAGLGLAAEFGAFAAGVRAGARVDARARTRAATAAAAVDHALQEGAAGTTVATDTAPPPSPSPSPSPAPSPAPSPSSQLTFAFSELGFAQLLLKQGKPADALAALAELRCRACRARRSSAEGSTRPTGVAAAVCEPDCGRFDELNPGYAAHPDKHRRLARDARDLALRARLDAGRVELTARRPDFDAAAASWRRALVHGRELERYSETQAAVVDLALGAARAAHRAGDPTRAVDTLEAVHAITGANERGRLEGQLARLLADRGIRAVNRDGTLLDAPAADLRRSVALNPHLLRAQVSLGVVLRGLAARRWRSGSVSGARAALREALDQLSAALVHFPGDPELTEQHEAALADLDRVVTETQESGR